MQQIDDALHQSDSTQAKIKSENLWRIWSTIRNIITTSSLSSYGENKVAASVDPLFYLQRSLKSSILFCTQHLSLVRTSTSHLKRPGAQQRQKNTDHFWKAEHI